MKIRDKSKLFVILIYTAVILLGGYVGYRVWLNQHTMNLMYKTPFNQFYGPANSEKVMIEFLDYRCKYCREVHKVVLEFLDQNPDVKLIYRHMLVFERPSLIDAEIALAAGMHNKFEQAHEYLISREDPILDREIDDLAMSLGIDPKQFRKDMKDYHMGQFLIETINSSAILGIESVPTFIVGDVVYSLTEGMPTVETFEELLAQAYGE